MNFRGAKSVGLVDSKGKKYKVNFKGEYNFIKAIYPVFEYPTTFTLTIVNDKGQRLSASCKVKEKLVVYPR